LERREARGRRSGMKIYSMKVRETRSSEGHGKEEGEKEPGWSHAGQKKVPLIMTFWGNRKTRPS